MDTGKVKRILGVALFSIGVLVGLALCGSMIWGDLEASLFDVTMSGRERLKSLRCPAIITTRESGTVSTTIKNTLEKETEFTARTHISDGYVTLMKEINSKLSLQAGEKGTLEWEVLPEDAVYGGRLILARVYVFPKYPTPARHGTCGILVINSSQFTGIQILVFTLFLSLLGMLLGAGLWVVSNRPLYKPAVEVLYAMVALAGCVLAGIIAGLLGWWVPGVFLLTITILLIGAIIGYFVNKSGRASL
jgi:hypothetical protein